MPQTFHENVQPSESRKAITETSSETPSVTRINEGNKKVPSYLATSQHPPASPACHIFTELLPFFSHHHRLELKQKTSETPIRPGAEAKCNKNHTLNSSHVTDSTAHDRPAPSTHLPAAEKQFQNYASCSFSFLTASTAHLVLASLH